MSLTIFQAIAFVCLIVFTFFVSDFRNKKGMLPLINIKIVSILKLFYLVPIFVYIYVIINMKNMFFHNYIGLFCTFSGAFLVAKAKIDLGKYHTWAGHMLSSTKIITSGIYAFIRHPLYTGIYMFMIGGIMIGIKNNPFSLFATVIIIAFLVMIKAFLGFSAAQESKFLQEVFGDIFVKYKREVHAFLPIRKYSVSKDVKAES
ncbi:MAG: methyltransferase [Atribacterota bacterium]|nr:methyltransferase [Atribacterota bacterium]MDD5638169.1 methyltransferase [Atribacterota bacterium]